MTAYGSQPALARPKALAALALLGLTACATPAMQQAATAPAPAMSAARTPARAGVMGVPAPMPSIASVPAPQIATGPPTDAVSLRAAYGMPDFVRREVDSELWRYDGMGCAAFFFLYREGEVWRLRYSETMPRGREAPADPACLSALSSRREMS
jgi:hypothetical protein